MEKYYTVAWMLYAILGVGAVAFVVWILPSLIVETITFFRQEWNLLYNWAWNKIDWALIEVKEHFQFLEAEKGRHRKMDFEGWFHEAVIELREVNEGRRMPVSIHG